MRETTISTEGAIKTIDFCADHNIPYMLFDWLWYLPCTSHDGDATKYNVALNASGAARVSRNWSFPFHAGNYPILAFRMNRADGVTMSLYSGSNSWNNAYDAFDGKIGDEVFYYNLVAVSFQNSKGVAKTEFATDAITSVPLQLRLAGPAGAVASLKWIATFRDVDSLRQYVESGSDAVSEMEVEEQSQGIYNLMGVFCGYDPSSLPAGIYIINGNKTLIK